MSALDDIRAALRAAPPLQHEWERVVFLGISARRSIEAAVVCTSDEADYSRLFFGAMLREEVDFPGWAIRDVDPEGRWHDIDFL